MFAEALPDHPSKTETAQHVGRLLGISPDALRTGVCRNEIDAGLAPEITSESELEI